MMLFDQYEWFKVQGGRAKLYTAAYTYTNYKAVKPGPPGGAGTADMCQYLPETAGILGFIRAKISPCCSGSGVLNPLKMLGIDLDAYWRCECGSVLSHGTRYDLHSKTQKHRTWVANSMPEVHLEDYLDQGGFSSSSSPLSSSSSSSSSSRSISPSSSPGRPLSPSLFCFFS